MGQTDLSGGSFTVIPNARVLRDLRAKESKLQREVEEAAGLPTLRLSQYECGKPISLDHLKALAKYYRVSPATLTHPNSIELAHSVALAINEIFAVEK